MNNENSSENDQHGPFGPSHRRKHGRHWRRHMAQVPKGFLRRAVLKLIIENPRSGSEIIQAIDEETLGRWKPSPGSVYPLLSLLQDSGYIIELPRDESGLKRYKITEVGKQVYTEQKEQHEKRGSPWINVPFLVNGHFNSLPKESRKQIHQATSAFYKALYRLRVRFSKNPSDQNAVAIISFFKEAQTNLTQLIDKVDSS